MLRNQPEVITPTVRLQLRVATLAKLLIRVSSMTRPTLRQLSPDTVLARVVGGLRRPEDTCRVFCSAAWQDARRPRAETQPMAEERDRISQLMGKHVPSAVCR